MGFHEYLLKIDKWFGGEFRFQIKAMDKVDALEKGIDYIKSRPEKNKYIMDSIKVIRKLPPSGA